jgi:hypothetical protein
MLMWLIFHGTRKAREVLVVDLVDKNVTTLEISAEVPERHNEYHGHSDYGAPQTDCDNVSNGLLPAEKFKEREDSERQRDTDGPLR